MYDLKNPQTVIDFIVDNNFSAVQINMQAYNLMQGGITPSVAKLELKKAWDKCTDIRDILTVPFQERGDNYTHYVIAGYNPAAPAPDTFSWAMLMNAVQTTLKRKCVPMTEFIGNTPIQNVQYTPPPKPEQSSPRPTGTQPPPPPPAQAPAAPAPVNSALFSLEGFSGKQKIAAVFVLFVLVTLIAFRGS